MSSYTHLTHCERYQISAFLRSGKSINSIAKELNRNKSTISREIRRNSGLRGYRSHQAHEKAVHRLKISHRYIKITQKVICKIKKLLHCHWSPEQICGYLHPRGLFVSHESIYQYILKDKKSGGCLYKLLRCQRKRKQRYGMKRFDKRGQIKNRVSIDQRPKIVDKKSRTGDWEGDLIMGKNHKGALVTLVDRCSKKTRIVKVESKRSETVLHAISKALKHEIVHTLTLDNGKEFSCHEKIREYTGGKVYFAHPYSSYERGLNENTNGLIRQYFPKKTDFRKITQKDVKRVECLLNHRPRKTLGFLSPHKFHKQKMAC